MQELPHDITCPFCWETINILLDPSVAEQEYIEDCQVCCNPINFTVTFSSEGESIVEARNPED